MLDKFSSNSKLIVQNFAMTYRYIGTIWTHNSTSTRIKVHTAQVLDNGNRFDTPEITTDQ